MTTPNRMSTAHARPSPPRALIALASGLMLGAAWFALQLLH